MQTSLKADKPVLKFVLLVYDKWFRAMLSCLSFGKLQYIAHVRILMVCLAFIQYMKCSVMKVVIVS